MNKSTKTNSMNQYTNKYKRNNETLYKLKRELTAKGIKDLSLHFDEGELKRVRKSVCKCGRFKTLYSSCCKTCALSEHNKVLSEKKKITYLGKGNNRYGTHHSNKTKKIIKNKALNCKVINHHKYLRQNSDEYMILTSHSKI